MTKCFFLNIRSFRCETRFSLKMKSLILNLQSIRSRDYNPATTSFNPASSHTFCPSELGSTHWSSTSSSQEEEETSFSLYSPLELCAKRKSSFEGCESQTHMCRTWSDGLNHIRFIHASQSFDIKGSSCFLSELWLTDPIETGH